MRLAVLLFVALLSLARPGWAGDGTWTQVDLWQGGGQAAMNIERGRIVWGLAAGDDDGEPWLRASALYGWKLGGPRFPWRLRAGPALKAEKIGWWEVEDHRWAHCLDAEGDRCGSLRAGLRLSVDRWAEHGRWGTFVMADYTGIDDAKLLVGGMTHLPSRVGAQLSIWHEAGGEVTPAVMLSVPATKRLSLRVGHKFVEDETFVGFSFSTY